MVSASCSSCGGRGSLWTPAHWGNCYKPKAPLGASLSGVEGGESMLTQRETPTEFSLLESWGERLTLACGSATGGFQLGDPASPSPFSPVKLTAEAGGIQFLASWELR